MKKDKLIHSFYLQKYETMKFYTLTLNGYFGDYNHYEKDDYIDMIRKSNKKACDTEFSGLNICVSSRIGFILDTLIRIDINKHKCKTPYM